MKVAIRLGSLGTGSLKRDIQRAMAIGVHGLQLDVVDTEIDPRELPRSGREELADYVESFGFELAALCGDLGGFADDQSLDQRVSRTHAMLDMCVDLRVPLLTVRAGAIPEKDSRGFAALAGVVRELASYALNRDIRLALSTGSEAGDRLAEFATAVKSEGIRINLDPGELCASGFDAVAGTRALLPMIAHAQANDATRGTLFSPGGEAPLNQGDAGVEEIVDLLRGSGYRGFFSVSRRRDTDLAASVVDSVTWLKRQDGIDP